MGARFSLCAPGSLRRPAILPSAGGRWPPLREGPICAACFPNRRRGAHWAPVLPRAFRVAFRKPTILLPAGGQWPPLRENPICAACFPNRRRGARSALHALPGFPQTRNFISGWRPMAAPTRRPHLCRSRSGTAVGAPALSSVLRAVFRLPFPLLSPIFARNSCCFLLHPKGERPSFCSELVLSHIE